MHTIDARMLSHFRRLDDTLLSTQIRQLESLTPAEIALELSWTTALDPVLTNLYWWPLRNGLEQAPTDPAELRRWLENQYHDDDDVVLALLLLLLLYQERAVNIGGREGLALLGVGGDFSLTNRRLLDRLETQARRLATVGGEMSLIRTTIDHLATDIPVARESANSTLLTLAGMITGHVLARSPLIAGTELARNFANGLSWVFGRNGIRRQIFTTRLDSAVCRICAPLHGREMDVNNIPSELIVPVHVGCRCVYVPVMSGWEAPETIWRGE